MDNAVGAALTVFGLERVPKTQDELKKVYRKYAKLLHPDNGSGNVDINAMQRLNRARAVVAKAIEDEKIREKEPSVYVKFGDGIAQKANVRCLDVEQNTYEVILKWFYGMLIQVNTGEWIKVESSESFELSNVKFVLV